MKKIYLSLFIVGLFLGFSSPVFSANSGSNGNLILAQVAQGTSNIQNLKGSTNKLGTIGKAYGETQKTLPDLVGGIIKTALTLLGVIFLILTVYGGYKWMLARGESKEVETAKDIMTRAIIGLIIVLAAYAITYFVVARLTQEAGIVIK